MILPFFILSVDTKLYSYRTLPNLVKGLGVLANYSTRLKILRPCSILQIVELIFNPLSA